MITRRQVNGGLLAGVVLAAAPGLAAAQAPGKPRDLPKPREEGGKTLTAALKARHSTRDYANKPLPAQQLSNLLWAAWGVNRASGGRTAPAWRNKMLVDIYVAAADGTWLYEPKAHKLQPVSPEDMRADTGTQDFVATAPVNLVYVGHGEMMSDVSEADRQIWAAANTGFIGQNVYLYCASEGLATVYRANLNRARLAKILKLPEQQFVIAAQTVGYPKA